MNPPDEREGLPSCSNLERYHACPGSWALEHGIKQPEESMAAKFGTLVHEWLAENDVSLSEAQEVVGRRCKDLELEVIAACGDPKGCKVRERRYWLAPGGRKRLSGRADLVISWFDGKARYASIIDYKTGRIETPKASRNRQLDGLVVCVDDEDAHTKWLVGSRIEEGWKSNLPFDQIFTAIIAPFQKHKVSIASYERADIERARWDTINLLNDLDRPDAPRNPGDHCRHCLAKYMCPELQGLTTAQTQELAKPDISPTKDSMAVAAKGLSADRLALLLEWKERRQWANDAIEAEAKRRLTAGEKLPGWKLGKPGKREHITNLALLYGKMDHKIDSGDFTAKCSMTKKALTELVGEAYKLKGEPLNNQLKELLEGCTIETATKPALEREETT